MKLVTRRIISAFLSALTVLGLIAAGVITTSAVASYGAEWWDWSQAQSAYGTTGNGFIKWGCLMVAQAKMLKQSGVVTNSAFTPDDYLFWCVDNGKLVNPPTTAQLRADPAIDGSFSYDMIDVPGTPLAYPSQSGNTLSLVTSRNSPSQSDILSWVDQEYYVICKVSGGNHFTYVDRDNSKSLRRVVYNDSGSTIFPPSTHNREWSTYDTPVTAYVYRADQTPVTPTIDRDTVLVLDYSGSMNGAPLVALKEAAIVFCEGVAAASGTNRVAIVIYDSTIRFQNFTQDLDAMRAYINNTRGGGNTNIAGALKKAGELMSTSTAGVKNVLLMTDGMPNTGSSVADGKYTSADHNSYRYANAAYTAAVELWNAQCNVYTLGFFHSLNATDTAFGRRFLTDMQSDGYWEVINIEDIEDAFKEILKEMQLDPEKWWELLPGWLQFILRYIFFGWLWMNWF